VLGERGELAPDFGIEFEAVGAREQEEVQVEVGGVARVIGGLLEVRAVGADVAIQLGRED
jgi:hypothetical protein